MPDSPFSTTHRLAALIAVERDAADRYRAASVAVNRAIVGGVDTDRYRSAAAEEDAAMRAMITARIEVDNLLASTCALVADPANFAATAS